MPGPTTSEPAPGLAVGIDYSLFVVSRFREERRAGRDVDDAVAVAGATASRAVLFSGATVVLALGGMFLVPQTLFRSIAAGAIAVVLVSVLAALTLLPAALAILGDRIERLRVPLLGGRASGSMWSRVAAVALRRPGRSLAAGVAVLAALAVPYAGVDTGKAGVGTLPESFQTRSAYLAIEAAFGPQGTAAAEVVVRGERTPELRAAVASLRAALAQDRDYGKTSVAVARAAAVTRVTVPVSGDAVSAEAMTAVRDLRERYVPHAFAGVDAEALVGGQSADELDFAHIAQDRQPIVFAFVLGLSFLVLVAAFRSLVIPLTAIATNLLSVAAAYGLLVLVFQHGAGADLLGFAHADTVEAWLPLFLFTILFGLSMDYHVFLLSRIRERWLATGDTVGSVAFGIGATARLITARSRPYRSGARGVGRGHRRGGRDGRGAGRAAGRRRDRGLAADRLVVRRQRLPERVEAAAYYVVSEALTNIAKYAHASVVGIRVLRTDDRAVVEVADDGIGGADRSRGTGLRGLSDRVDALGGTLRVESPPGRGTVIHAEIPCA